jgi:hypothetical protein
MGVRFNDYPVGEYIEKSVEKVGILYICVMRRVNGKTTKEYRAWKNMKARCYAPCNGMTTYVQKGIGVSESWKNSFEAFLDDMGQCPIGYSLDRIDNSGNYCKENCRWADNKTQSSNRSGFNISVTYQGETKILKDWARHFNMKYTTLYMRMYRNGYTFEEAVQN